jgi:hypothetical protein
MSNPKFAPAHSGQAPSDIGVRRRSWGSPPGEMPSLRPPSTSSCHGDRPRFCRLRLGAAARRWLRAPHAPDTGRKLRSRPKKRGPGGRHPAAATGRGGAGPAPGSPLPRRGTGPRERAAAPPWARRRRVYWPLSSAAYCQYDLLPFEAPLVRSLKHTRSTQNLSFRRLNFDGTSL